MQPNFVRAWNRTPLMVRLSVLARLATQGEQAQLAVMKLIDLISVMASMLNSEARIAIANQLRGEAEALAPSQEELRRLH